MLKPDGTLAETAFNGDRLKTLFTAIKGRTEADTVAFYAEVAAWFDNAMSQGTASYKRRAQLLSLIVGLAIAVVFNVDAVRITALSLNSAACEGAPAHAADASAQPPPPSLVSALGWSATHRPFAGPDFAVTIFGWLATALTCFLLSPLWFDIMSRFANLRTEVRPALAP